MDAIIEKIVAGLLDGLGNEYLVTFIISMIPMIEVRGAIPIAMQMGMNGWAAYFFACASAFIMCPIIILCLRPLLNAFKKTKLFKKLANSVEEMFRSKAKKIEDDAENKTTDETQSRKLLFYKMLGLFVFVAIPLPMTGVWTASAIAVFINMKTKHAMVPIAIGNFVAGAIIMLMTLILGDKSWIILLVLCGFVIISICGVAIKLVLSARKKKALAAAEANKETASSEPIVYTDKETE